VTKQKALKTEVCCCYGIPGGYVHITAINS